MRDTTACTCPPGHNGRTDTKCSDCQNAIRRATKRNRNHYRPHGPCMTAASREYWRREAAAR